MCQRLEFNMINTDEILLKLNSLNDDERNRVEVAVREHTRHVSKKQIDAFIDGTELFYGGQIGGGMS